MRAIPKIGSGDCKIVWAVAAAVTDAITIGVNVLAVKSRRMTSSTKKTPASGAPKTAESPAAAPQPSSVVLLPASKSSHEAKVEPIAAPIATIGPSGPAEPPELIVAVDPIHCLGARLRGNTDFCRWTASMTRETPWPLKELGKIRKTMTVIAAPASGIVIAIQS